MAAGLSAALTLAFALQSTTRADSSAPIHLEVHATPGLQGTAPFWVELDATGTRTEDRESDWVRDYHFKASDGAESDLGVFDHTFVQPGRYDVQVTARDADGHVAATTVQVVVTTPAGATTSVLQPRVDADPGFEGAAPFWVHLDARRSEATDPNDWIYAYHWETSDGASGSTADFDHLFGAPGRYTVRLAIEDLYGRHASWSRTIAVAPGDEAREPSHRTVVLPGNGR
ncbi:MAG TPA: PKD domain-containing protein [Myxococcales bacterium]|nr:PKD domain-containing protein [Myxococcales bacterium]